VGQKNVTMWGYVADPLVFVVNKDIWNSWTPADREIVRQAAIDAGKEEIAIARKGLDEPGQAAAQGHRRAGRDITPAADARRARRPSSRPRARCTTSGRARSAPIW
jgi:TRAP-type C4-dicarboxylate transport system substrate-binding protein